MVLEGQLDCCEEPLVEGLGGELSLLVDGNLVAKLNESGKRKEDDLVVDERYLEQAGQRLGVLQKWSVPGYP